MRVHDTAAWAILKKQAQKRNTTAVALLRSLPENPHKHWRCQLSATQASVLLDKAKAV